MLRVEKICKKAGLFLLSDIRIEVNQGDYFILIGQSGAGKTMLLEIIAGLVRPDSGKILLHDKDIVKTPIQKRRIGLVYQKPTLFPHMTVFDNIAFPLKIKKLKKAQITGRVEKLADETDILHLLNRKTTNLSGGEAQRVTIARTLAINPDVLMLDEPLSFLDIQLKRGISSLLRKINQNGQTIIHVTHDYEEAIAFANKIAIIENGTIIETGSPQDVFQNPRSCFVANFIGINNFFKGTLLHSVNHPGMKTVDLSGIKINIISKEKANVDGFLIIPCESVVLSEDRYPDAVNQFEGVIKDRYRTKYGMEIIVDIGIEISAQIPHIESENQNLYIGKEVRVHFRPDALVFKPLI